jgi:hypothetical protein
MNFEIETIFRVSAFDANGNLLARGSSTLSLEDAKDLAIALAMQCDGDE